MRYAVTMTALALTATAGATGGALLDRDFRRLASDEVVNLQETYGGKVLLVVNTASRCGNTPQYEGLEKLYAEFADDGLVVVGFPSNDFFGQEPGTEKEIQEFCRLTYKVKFPMFEKVSVKGDDAHPFFVDLAAQSGTYPRWNFHKFLIGRDGRLIKEFSPRTKPWADEIVTEVRAALAE